jgi:hypothetical protein
MMTLTTAMPFKPKFGPLDLATTDWAFVVLMPPMQTLGMEHLKPARPSSILRTPSGPNIFLVFVLLRYIRIRHIMYGQV